MTKMRSKSLTGKLLFVGVISLVFTSIYVSAEHYFTAHIRGEGTRINMAGNLRYRSYKIGWLLHRLVEKKSPELIETIRDEMKAFEEIAGTLSSGQKDIDVMPVTETAEITEIEGIISKWNGGIKPMVLDILEHPDDRARQILDRYDSKISPFVSEINDYVGLLEIHFNEEIKRIDRFRIYALVLFIIVAPLVVFYIRKGIIKPLSTLKDVAKEIGKGNYGIRIDFKGDDDIKFLAETMNEMALGIEGAITNLEDLVQQRTAEIKASNADLQTSYMQLEATTADLREANQGLAEANDELKGLSRLKAHFLQTISHELRSPLSPILGYLELMRDGSVGELTSKQKEVVAEMHICGRSMQLLVDELLEVASMQAGNILLEFKEVDLSQLLQHAVKEERKYADEKSTEIDVRVPADPVLLVGDSKSLSGIFTHLLRNAVKFSREKGKVEVEVKVMDNGVEVTVSDMGIGIPQDKLDKIFDVFYQVDSSPARRFEGVGLGLYLVKKLTALHKGTIRVKSKEGEGTAFSVFIPSGLEKRDATEVFYD